MDITCPYCGYTGDACNFPDLFYRDITNTEEINAQVDLLYDMNEHGFNIVTCGDCGRMFIHRTEWRNNQC